MDIQHFRGQFIPEACRNLSHSMPGQIRWWFDSRRAILAGSVVFEVGVPVAWCCYHPIRPAYAEYSTMDDVIHHPEFTHAYNFGTYTNYQYRGKGYGRAALRHALAELKSIDEYAIVRYGGSTPWEFNNTYLQEIATVGLGADNWFG